MSAWFERINRFYNTILRGKRLWDISRVQRAVETGHITEEEYKEITGEDYNAG